MKRFNKEIYNQCVEVKGAALWCKMVCELSTEPLIHSRRFFPASSAGMLSKVQNEKEKRLERLYEN